jgi:hypothetical protein
MLKKIIFVVLSVLSLSLAAHADDSLPDGWRRYPTLDGFTALPIIKPSNYAPFTFQIIRKDSKWQRVENESTDNEQVEILGIDPQRKTVWLIFKNGCTGAPADQTCQCLKGLTGESRRKNGYQLCTSNFKTFSANAKIVGTTVLAPLSLILGGNLYTSERVDLDAVLAAAKEANLLDVINQRYHDEYKNALTQNSPSLVRLRRAVNTYKAAQYDPDTLIPAAEKQIADMQLTEADAEKTRFHEKYRKTFSNASSSEQWRSFVATYGNNDPDQLIPGAKEKLEIAEIQEEKARKQKAEQQEEQRRKQAKEEADRQAQEQRQLAAFRKTLRDGDETNCGPVIEVKGKLVKISFAVANYGNEHWIRVAEIFPNGYNCRFYNGEYQPPQ